MGVDIQGMLRQALCLVKDHASIGKAMLFNHHDGFSDIEITVLRATGHDNSTPLDDNYMHEILFLVSNSPGSITFLSERISCRLGKTKDNLVALKMLVLIHRLLRGGNRYFEHQLRSAHFSGHLQMTSTKWLLKNVFDLSVCFLHKYVSYLEERMGWVINQAGKLEPVLASKGIEFQCYEEKSIDMAFRKLPKCQELIDRVLDLSPLINILPSLDNKVLAQAGMANTLKESFQVYTTFCESIAALVDTFFDLTRQTRALACHILKRASHQSLGLHDLYENCKHKIENKNLQYPVVQIINLDHVMALEKCLSCTHKNPSISCVPLLGSITSSGTAPSTLNQVPKSITKRGRKGKQIKSDVSLSSSTLFSCTLETKISKVWVVFEDEVPDQFRASVGKLVDETVPSR